MILGAHVVLYSRDSDADRAFLKDVLDLLHVDAGGGWLIFRLAPPRWLCTRRTPPVRPSSTWSVTTPPGRPGARSERPPAGARRHTNVTALGGGGNAQTVY
jgi:hypothetical protein